MSLQVGDRVRITRGDMRGRIGVIERALGTGTKGGRTYGVVFPGEPVANFRASNLEAVGTQEPVPEFLEFGGVIHRLVGDEPYELITGGLMGKRRRYGCTVTDGTLHFADTRTGVEVHDFRRFPIERDGSVVGGLWSGFQPHPEHIAYILSLIATPSPS